MKLITKSTIILIIVVSSKERVLQGQVDIKAESGRCTPGSCLFCNTDGRLKWCEKCGNGKMIRSTGKGRHCSSKDMNVDNCFKSWDASFVNPDSCDTCKRGYYLENRKSCRFINFPNCDFPVKEGNIFKCFGCEKMFVKDDYSGCGKRIGLPENCFYGDRESSLSCRLCDNGYRLISKFEENLKRNVTICQESHSTGCKLYDEAGSGGCLACDSENGFYAVDAVMAKSNKVYQICSFFSGIFGINSSLLIILIFIITKN